MECHEAAAEADLKNFQEGKSVSLLAKWIKTADSKNGDEKTRHSDGAETRLSGLQLQKNRPFLRKYIGVLK